MIYVYSFPQKNCLKLATSYLNNVISSVRACP